MADARFQDGADQPIYLGAQDGDDLAVVSALLQDGVFAITDLRYDRKKRRFALLVNRFRWEDRDAADRAARGYERVRCLLLIEEVLAIRSNGIDRGAKDTVLSLLSVQFAPGTDGAGTLTLTLAGDGAIALDIEALAVTAKDVTRPYLAPSHRAPDHGL